ncbi:MAG: erythromycin esterase family protein [Flavobacteriales bacterium]
MAGKLDRDQGVPILRSRKRDSMRLHHPLLALALFICAGSSAQSWSAEQARLTANEAKLIDTDSLFTDCDWSALGTDLVNKDLVLIGEQNHGSREIFDLRNSLIAELQAKHGFDVVLFESGMGELLMPDSASAEDLANGLTGPWNTTSFADLMRHLTEQRIAYAGFDVQRSGRSFVHVLRSVCAALRLDSTLYAGLEQRYGVLAKNLGPKADHATVRGEAEQLIADYERLLSVLGDALPKAPDTQQLLTHRTLKNRADFLRYMLQFTADKDWSARWAARDSAMAGNVRWLADVVYPGHKLVIIAHNYHIARNNANEKTMGEWLHAHYADRMFVIGSFAGGGTYADNTRKPTPMLPPDSSARDIKHVITGLGGFAHYLRIPAEPTPGTQWLYEPVVVKDTFIDFSDRNTLVPAQHFDALLLIARVSPPVFLDP